MVQKVVINTTCGGFGISDAARHYIAEKKGTDENDGSLSDPDIERDDPALVEAVESLHDAAGEHACLKIVEVPDGVEWYIAENDMGVEWVAEKHRTWY